MVSTTIRLFACLIVVMLAGCMDKTIPLELDSSGDLRDDFAKVITDGNEAAVKEMLAAEPLLLNEPLPGRENKAPLHFAAMTGNEAVVRFLVEQGADPYAVDDEGQYPQELAVQAGADQTVVDLLQHP